MADNMNPHAEARLAMALWGEEYAGQNGGCMDFWNNLRPHRQRLCVDILDGVLKALEANGRAGDRSFEAIAAELRTQTGAK